MIENDALTAESGKARLALPGVTKTGDSQSKSATLSTSFRPGLTNADARRRRHYGAAQFGSDIPQPPSPNPHTPSGRPTDADFVIHRLNEAGATLLALPNTGPSTRLRQGGLEWVRDVAEAYGAAAVRIRPAIPNAAQIDRMDQALAWISRIPDDRYVLRRIVGARCLTSPLTSRPLYSWRRIGLALGADHKAIQRWHSQGIDLIVKLLNA